MTERYQGPFSRQQRDVLGGGLDARFQPFIKTLPPDHQSLITIPFGWMIEAHKNYIRVLARLRKEIGEDKALFVSQMNQPERLREGVAMIFKILEAIRVLSS
ncbi:MAG: hypothetical protein AAGJ35_14960, partial [Myxococcota bacterium]